LAGDTVNYKKKQGLEEQLIDDEVVLFDTDTFKFYELNETMTLVWQQLDSASVDDIVQTISKTYTVSVQQATKDVHNAIQELIKLELISKK
jgi:hypothetical protein